MKTILLFIPVVLLILWVTILKCRHDNTPRPSLFIPNEKNNSNVIDSLKQKLEITIDSFNAMKPAIQQAIKKLKYCDSLLDQKPTDPLFIERLKRDLFEARLEIKRLAEPRYYYLYESKNHK